MLMCIESYSLELHSNEFLWDSIEPKEILEYAASGKAGAQSLSALEVVLVIKNLRVISFDRF